MSIRRFAAPLAVALLIGGSLSIPTIAQQSTWQQGWGPGMMGSGNTPGCYGMMGPGMMGPGMMGQGMMMGPGMGWCMMGSPAPANLNLSVADVKTNLERWLAWQGNLRLKLGDIKEKDANIVTADITTTDGSLVQRLEVDRRTGVFRQAQ